MQLTPSIKQKRNRPGPCICSRNHMSPGRAASQSRTAHGRTLPCVPSAPPPRGGGRWGGGGAAGQEEVDAGGAEDVEGDPVPHGARPLEERRHRRVRRRVPRTPATGDRWTPFLGQPNASPRPRPGFFLNLYTVRPGNTQGGGSEYPAPGGSPKEIWPRHPTHLHSTRDDGWGVGVYHV